MAITNYSNFTGEQYTAYLMADAMQDYLGGTYEVVVSNQQFGPYRQAKQLDMLGGRMYRSAVNRWGTRTKQNVGLSAKHFKYSKNQSTKAGRIVTKAIIMRALWEIVRQFDDAVVTWSVQKIANRLRGFGIHIGYKHRRIVKELLLKQLRKKQQYYKGYK
tara:strand:- start:77 stop:556 length:480 start_codon:yes stop_codon:yes gene_type:complete